MQAVKFTLFSISAGIIQVASFAILEIFIKTYWIPYLVSLLLSIIWNFTLNRKFTFKSAANVPIAMAKVLGFYLVFTPLSTYLGKRERTIFLSLRLPCSQTSCLNSCSASSWYIAVRKTLWKKKRNKTKILVEYPNGNSTNIFHGRGVY